MIISLPPELETLVKRQMESGKFENAIDAIFAGNNRPYGTLEEDFVNVPIITKLTETVTIPVPTFSVTGDYTNIFFEAISI